MRVLLLIRSFNSLSQRLFGELTCRGHQVSVEFDIHPDVAREAVAVFQPELILAPFLKRAIPDDLWQANVCLVLHPGPLGDRGPAALDWAILNDEPEWGTTVIQATGEMDAGPVWAHAVFPMRPAPKGSLYRNEVTEAGIGCLLEAVARYERGQGPLAPGNSVPNRGWQGPVPAELRRIDWERDSSEEILRKIRAADGQPGALDVIDGRSYRLYGAEFAPGFGRRHRPGALVGTRDEAICRATADGGVWIRQLKPVAGDEPTFKLPATRALGDLVAGLPEFPAGLRATAEPCQEIAYRERGPVGILEFDFYNGAMSTEQCRRLANAYDFALARPTRAVVLCGGRDFWSNGMHLNCIEAAASPADESWRNINAMDDLSQRIIETESKLTVSALHGNAGAGGVFLALAADRIVARHGVVLNPHYKAIGNLYGSEYWTYLLPRRVGPGRAAEIMERRLPMLAGEALELGLIDQVLQTSGAAFLEQVVGACRTAVEGADFESLLARKRARRREDEAGKPLADYRQEELARMKLNFYGFDPSYHVARYRFVTHEPHAWTPLHLALHRRNDWHSPRPRPALVPS